MKRILKLSLALTFLIVSFGAFAQADATHSVGSIHTFKVNVDDTGHTGNAYTWAVYLKKADGTDGDATDMYAFVGNLDSGVDVKTVQIQWLAAGDYFVELSETNATGGCSTLRRVNVLVTAGDVDLLVVASDDGGSKLTGDDLTDCNDKSGEIIANAATNFGTSTRYFTVSMSTDTQPWVSGDWSFDFVVNQKHATTPTTTTTITNNSSVTVVDGAIAGISGTKVTVNSGNSFVILAVTVDNTPGASTDNDIIVDLVASNALITTTAGNTFEDNGNLVNNTPESFVIKASPETTVITIQ